jgi:hypothetical protein
MENKQSFKDFLKALFLGTIIIALLSFAKKLYRYYKESKLGVYA